MSIFSVGKKVRITANNKTLRAYLCNRKIVKNRVFTIKQVRVDTGTLRLGEELESYWVETDMVELVEKEYPNPPHKHKDFIIAWANGAKIEMHCGGGIWRHMDIPCWNWDEYRISKTTPKTKRQLKIEKLEAKLAKLKIQETIKIE